MNSSLLNKIRCRFLDRSTGKPVPGVIANLSVAIGDPLNLAHLPVATLCTDATGYMSFDLKPVSNLGLPVLGLFISAPRFGLTNYDLLGSLSAASHDEVKNNDAEVRVTEGLSIAREMMADVAPTNGEANRQSVLSFIVFPIYLENSLRDEDGSESESCKPIRFPSIQSPDVFDYRASPYSFVTPPSLKLGDDCCEVLLPSSLPVQQYRFNKVIVRQPEIDINLDAMIREVNVSAGLESLETQQPAIKFGEVLEYKQEWYSVGHSLGEIKYSLPLAPGESTQLAVVEWSRADVASRTDNIRATEFLSHDSRRDRSIEDTVDAALREEQGGNSHMGSTAGTGGGNWGVPGVWGAGIAGNHAFGGGISYSYGNRNVEGESLQDLHDRVRQASASIRSLNSTVIVQASQAENNTLHTRRVANHNHCHALTIQYYEVLRHYLIRTKFSDRREVVLIPFALFKFDDALALRFRTVLEQTLLDPSLIECFEALIRLQVSTVYDVPMLPTGDDTKDVKPIPRLKEKITLTGREGAGKDVEIKNLKKGDQIKIEASGKIAMSGGNGKGSAGVDPDGWAEAGTGGNYPYLAEPEVRRIFSLIYKIAGVDEWQQGGRKFELYAQEDGDITIAFGVNNLSNAFDNFSGEYWTISYEYPVRDTDIPPVTDPSEDPVTNKSASLFRKSDDELCSARLIKHLENNQGYYNSAVWMLLDPVERRLYLEAALQDRPDILIGMGDKPLAISGNYVAFPYSGPLELEKRIEEPLENVVTLPTRGLFAEAQMGHCNSCEKRDVTRMWDWTEMTTETPPEIAAVTQGPKGQLPSITPGQLPGNVIQITTPQAAPDPTGLANALGVLKTPDIFRDMAGLDEVSDLLGELAKASGDAYSKGLATLAQQKVEKAKTAIGSSGTSQTQTPEERYDNLQVAKEIAKSADELGLSEKQMADLTQDIIGGGGGAGGFWANVQKIVEDAIKGAKPATIPPEHRTLAEKAKIIADQPILVKAYENFQAKTWKWWFSPNNKLDGAVSQPAGLNNWSDWDNLRWQQRAVLADVAGLNANSLARTNNNLTKLQNASTEWPDKYDAVFQSGTTEDTNTCNLFLGDALTLDGRAQVRADGKYYSAQQIYKGDGGFREVNLFYVSVGDIACWGSHVEIVTKVDFSDGTFCSRGGYRRPIGGEICEADTSNGRRKLDYSGLRFMRIE